VHPRPAVGAWATVTVVLLTATRAPVCSSSSITLNITGQAIAFLKLYPMASVLGQVGQLLVAVIKINVIQDCLSSLEVHETRSKPIGICHFAAEKDGNAH
jgi:hypothetical protein